MAISVLWFGRLGNDSELNCNNRNLYNDYNRVRGIVYESGLMLINNNMEKDSLYGKICSMNNLANAWRKARKHKTKKPYVIEFESNLCDNLLKLQEELKNQTYKPEPLKTFILRDPKTRRISKSAFRDRIVHHALVRLIEPIFDKSFIYDSCANRIRKGNLFALERFELFKKKVTNNRKTEAFCLKADIKHYFEEVNHEILLKIIRRKIDNEEIISIIGLILNNFYKPKGMPLGNLTSQFFANVYLNELDYFVKHKLKIKYYIRYVDDFIIFYENKEQLESWKAKIDNFLRKELKLELHPQKSKIVSISRGIDFVGFRNFYFYRLLRKRNIKEMVAKINRYKNDEISKEKMLEIFQGWNAYTKWTDSFRLRRELENFINLP